MEAAAFRFLFFSSIFIFQTIPVRSVLCNPASCDPRGPAVRFPFWLKHRQPDDCGADDPGFELDCNDQNQTVMNLPHAGEFIVGYIDYRSQSFYLEDPGGCLARRTMNFSIDGSRFREGAKSDFEYYSCPNSSMSDPVTRGSYVQLPCRLSKGGNDDTTFVAAMANSQTPPQCEIVAKVSAPLTMKFSPFVRRWSTSEPVVLELAWNTPNACGLCEMGGDNCGQYQVDSGREIGCSRTRYRSSQMGGGLPAGAKYGITIGVGIPALICIIGLASYACGLFKTSRRQQRLGSGLPTTTTTTLSYETSPIAGLDRPTIESYPMTVLGASRRLPKPSDNTCPICLSEYEPKDALRSIPECNHYFHAKCVDEWLKLNGSCPICRNSPERSSTATSCSSDSSTSSQTSDET